MAAKQLDLRFPKRGGKREGPVILGRPSRQVNEASRKQSSNFADGVTYNRKSNPTAVDYIALIGDRSAVVRGKKKYQTRYFFRKNHSL